MSTPSVSKTVQNQPSGKYRLEYSPFDLPDDFPVAGGSSAYRQLDAPITRLHIHNCLELGYCHSGSGIFVVEEKVFNYRQGDVAVINDRELHLSQSTKGTVSEWSFIMIDPVRLLGPRMDDPLTLSTASLCGKQFSNILPGERHPDIAALVKELGAELAGKRPGYRSVVRGLMWAIMIRLNRLPGRMAGEPAASTRMDMGRVAPALQHLALHYMDPQEIGELARRCSLSLTHFRRLFSRAVGKSPRQYLTNLRMQMAATLLENTNHKVLDISLDVGYSTLSSFNRHFRAIMGISPREWRRRDARD